MRRYIDWVTFFFNQIDFHQLGWSVSRSHSTSSSFFDFQRATSHAWLQRKRQARLTHHHSLLFNLPCIAEDNTKFDSQRCWQTLDDGLLASIVMHNLFLFEKNIQTHRPFTQDIDYWTVFFQKSFFGKAFHNAEWWWHNVLGLSGCGQELNTLLCVKQGLYNMDTVRSDRWLCTES